MRMRLKRRCWTKLLAVTVAGGALFQTSTCTTTPEGLAQQWLLSVVEIWVTDYFNSQFNVAGSFF